MSPSQPEPEPRNCPGPRGWGSDPGHQQHRCQEGVRQPFPCSWASVRLTAHSCSVSASTPPRELPSTWSLLCPPPLDLPYLVLHPSLGVTKMVGGQSQGEKPQRCHPGGEEGDGCQDRLESFRNTLLPAQGLFQRLPKQKEDCLRGAGLRERPGTRESRPT